VLSVVAIPALLGAAEELLSSGGGSCVVVLAVLVMRLLSVQMWEAVKSSASFCEVIIIIAVTLPGAPCLQLRLLAKLPAPLPLPVELLSRKSSSIIFAGQACRYSCVAVCWVAGACLALCCSVLASAWLAACSRLSSPLFAPRRLIICGLLAARAHLSLMSLAL